MLVLAIARAGVVAWGTIINDDVSCYLLGDVAVRSAAGLESLLIFVEMKIINALRIRTNFF